MATRTVNARSKRQTEQAFTLRCLEPSEYPLWDALVDVSPQGSVFCRSWWLSAVGDIRVLACFSGDQIIAGIPLYFERHFGIPVCTMPKLTQTWGIVIQPLNENAVVAAARETKILRAFASRLSRYSVFVQAFHPNLSNWLPFYWSGFLQTTRFTYVLDDLADLDGVWQGISDGARGSIRKAQNAGLTVVPCGIEEVYRCECLRYGRQGRTPSHNESLLKRIYRAAQEHDSGACFAVVDPGGTVHSALLLVWDRNRAYYLVAGIDNELKKSGANSMGVWEAIQFAARRSRAFDFAGSVIEGVERFNRSFGAKQVAYNYVTKIPPLARCYLQLRGKL